MLRGKERLYYPDFIVDGSEITEVKGLGFIYEKKKNEIEAKRKALEYFCCANKQYQAKFVTNQDIEEEYKKKAKRMAIKMDSTRKRVKK